MQKCTGLYKGHGAFFVWGEKRFYPYIAAFLSPLLADAEYDAIQKSIGDTVDVVEMSCIFAVYGAFCWGEKAFIDVVEPAEILCVIGCEDMLVGSSKDCDYT